jgi:probable F420-dependent oxidoreductase
VEVREMKYGAGLPIRAATDPGAIREYAVALEQAGFDFTGTAGHALAQPDGTHPGQASARYVGPFHDPFVTFAFLASATSRIRFMSAILILPTLPTGLVAKQAAELFAICGGRFDLGIGISWNEAEYRALGADFITRGARMEEQVQVLRRLWSDNYVSFSGRFHDLDRVGLNRGAVPVPIWFGTETGERALRRVARLGDGWMTIGDFLPHVARFQGYLREAGRDPAGFPIRASIVAGNEGEQAWIATARRYRDAGVTHINFGPPPDLTREQGLRRVIEARGAVAKALV